MSAGAFGATRGDVAENGLIFTNKPGFWQKLGLSRSPFDDSSMAFFAIPDSEELCSKLKRFRASNDCLFVIPGIMGSGVTTVINKFIDEQDDDARIHYLDATTRLSLDKIIVSLSDKFAEFKNISREFPHLLQQLELLNNEVGGQLLIIDNAHFLSKETLLGLLLVLAQQELAATQFRVVLCGDLQLEDQVEGLLRELELVIPRQKFNLSPFSLNETYDYLQLRFHQAGLSGKMPFTPTMIRQIHGLSGGFPGRINRVAQQVLIDSYKDERTFMDTKSEVIAWFQERKVRLLSIAGLTFALCGLWYMQDRGIIGDMVAFTRARIIPKPPTSVAVNASEQQHIVHKPVVARTHPTPTEAAQVLVDAIAASLPGESDGNADQIAASELKHLSYVGHQGRDRYQPVPHKVVDVKPASIAPLESAKASEKAEAKAEAEAAATVVAKNTEAKPTAAPAPAKTIAAKTVTPKKVALTDIREAERDLMRLGGYTLQIMGSYKPEYVADYINKQKLPFDDVAYFETKNKEKPWFVLVYGQFDNVAEAKAAIASLPKNIQDQHPWVKPLTDVHSAIRTHG